MRAGVICNRGVIVARADETVIEAARLMRYHHVGDLVVVKSRGEQNVPVGILTDRDLVVEVMAEIPDQLNRLCIGDVIAMDEIVTADESTEVSELIGLMRRRALRRLPVVSSNGELVGIVSYDDLVEFLADQLAELAGVAGRQIDREQQDRS